MIPRLAGWALKGLTGAGSKGAMKIGGRTLGSMGREALTDAALIYGASQVPNAIGVGLGAADGSLASDRLEELAGTKPQGGKYKITTQDRLGNVVSDLASKVGIGDGAQVTQESIAARKGLNDYNDFKDAYSKVGAVAPKNVSRGEKIFLERGLKLATEADAERRLKGSIGYLNQEEAKTYTRGRQEMQYDDNQTKEKIARQDRLASEQNSLNQALAELDFKKSQANRQYDYDNRMLDYKMKERKADRMQKIAMALGGLGQLFAA